MSKVSDLRDRLRCHVEHSGISSVTKDKGTLVDRFELAVRAEAEERVWELIERVLGNEFAENLNGSPDVGWFVYVCGDKRDTKGNTAREAVEAAANELGIEEQE